MRRLLSVVKKHLTPGPWVKRAEKRRPLSVATHMTERPRPPPLPLPTGAAPPRPLVSPPLDVDHLRVGSLSRRPGQPLVSPLCDTDLIIDSYLLARPPLTRASSETLGWAFRAGLPETRELFVRHKFIHFEPTYTVTVCEVAPYRLELRKPRPDRTSYRLSHLFRSL